ncbi:MAG: tetratricopeptide (TPR) repeat protein [Pseudohongiellaceae bacterium]|jgi:tetratricopeptide (TPR) repeat protein
MTRSATSILWALLALGTSASARPLHPDEGLLEIEQPQVVARNQQDSAGQQEWRVNVVHSQWIALMLIADEATSWTVDAGATTHIEGCGSRECRWLVVAANPDDKITVTARWSKKARGDLIIAAIQAPSGLRGPHAPVLRELYSLAAVEQSLHGDKKPKAAALVRQSLLAKHSQLSTADLLVAADFATKFGSEQLQSGRNQLALSFAQQAVVSLDPNTEPQRFPWYGLNFLEGNALMNLGKFASAQKTFHRLSQVSERFHDSAVQLTVSLSLAKVDLLDGRPEQCVAKLAPLIETPELQSTPVNLLAALTTLGSAFEVLGDFDEATDALKRAMELKPGPIVSARLQSSLDRVAFLQQAILR